MLILRSPYPDAGAGSSLLTGLLAYWTLDEASGTRADSTASHYDLTPTGAPGNASGRVGQAVALDGSTQFLAVASNADLQGGAHDRTWAGWVYLTAASTGRAISKDDGGSNREYGLQYDSGGNRLRFFGFFGGSIGLVTANTYGAVPLNTWLFVAVTWTTATATATLAINNGAADSGTMPGSTLDAHAAAFCLGAEDGAGEFWPGRLDEWGVWDRVLTSGEQTTLYNGGSGTTFPF